MRAASLALSLSLVAASAAGQEEGDEPPADQPPEPAKEPPEPAKEPPEPAKEPPPEPAKEPPPEPAPEPAKPAQPKRDPDEGIARPDGEDLRGLHPLIDLGAGVWVPSAPFVPDLRSLGGQLVGVTANGDLALGLNRYLVLELQGGFAWAPGECDGCSTMSVVGGAAIAYHLAQAFAFDPWASFGVAYRHTFLSYDGIDLDDVALGTAVIDGKCDPRPDPSGNPTLSCDDAFSALDFARFAVGGTFFPASVFGFGPYVELDVGLRDFSSPSFYVVFHSGLQITFDPMNAGTTAAPNLGAR